jgi:hypothetical protein
LLICTAVSVTFDWNLFMLGRYSEGLRLGLHNDLCVLNLVRYVQCLSMYPLALQAEVEHASPGTLAG